MKSHMTGSELLDNDAAEPADSWGEEALNEDNVRPKAQAAPGKWRSIEEYWEQRRLRDQIHDIFKDEEA